MQHARPDVDISTPGPTYIYANQINNISAELSNLVWRPSLPILKGQQMTAVNPNDQNVTLPISQYLALNQGTTGATAPNFPTAPGVRFTDGGVTWLNVGFYVN